MLFFIFFSYSGFAISDTENFQVGFGVKENSIKKMVRSESVDEDLILNCEKVSGIEDDDEYGQWTYSNRRFSFF